jgi:hypothetical protein
LLVLLVTLNNVTDWAKAYLDVIPGLYAPRQFFYPGAKTTRNPAPNLQDNKLT